MVHPPNSVLLLVGREEFQPPASFAGKLCVATADCIAVGVLSSQDGPTAVSIEPAPSATASVRLAEFVLETEGQLSVRDVYNREYLSVGVDPGRVLVTVWGDDTSEPSNVIFQPGVCA